MEDFEWGEAVGAVIGIAVVVGVVWLLIIGFRSWSKENAAHQAWLAAHCKLVSEVSDSTSWGYVGGHYARINNPGSKTYKCDDGTTRTESN